MCSFHANLKHMCDTVSHSKIVRRITRMAKQTGVVGEL